MKAAQHSKKRLLVGLTEKETIVGEDKRALAANKSSLLFNQGRVQGGRKYVRTNFVGLKFLNITMSYSFLCSCI